MKRGFNPEAADREVARLEARIARDEARVEKLTTRRQKHCRHPVRDVVEAPHYSGTFVTMPPFRVCRACGYAEEGWGAGYWRLPKTYDGIPEMRREDAERLVRGVVVSQDDMSKLGRYGKR